MIEHSKTYALRAQGYVFREYLLHSPEHVHGHGDVPKRKNPFFF